MVTDNGGVVNSMPYAGGGIDLPTSPQPADRQAVVRTAELFLTPGAVIEVRALQAATGHSRPATLSGFFDDPGALAGAVAEIASATGIYITINPVNPALLARSANHLKRADRGGTTSDGDILQRRWLPIDLDAVKPAGISSTDAEHEGALQRAREVRDQLRAEGWPEPILADSGNGAHLLYRIELPTNDGGLIQRCLTALAGRFDTDHTRIDTAIHNPARIMRLYGTRACKGDNLPDRPHRMSTLARKDC